jgi:hypothetical protein
MTLEPVPALYDFRYILLVSRGHHKGEKDSIKGVYVKGLLYRRSTLPSSL